MTFCDIPGEHGAEKKGLSPRALQQIRDQDALCLVLRDFDNPALTGDADPLGDLEAFHNEAQFIRISGAGLRESHAHDVMITREAPNYQRQG